MTVLLQLCHHRLAVVAKVKYVVGGSLCFCWNGNLGSFIWKVMFKFEQMSTMCTSAIFSQGIWWNAGCAAEWHWRSWSGKGWTETAFVVCSNKQEERLFRARNETEWTRNGDARSRIRNSVCSFNGSCSRWSKRRCVWSRCFLVVWMWCCSFGSSGLIVMRHGWQLTGRYAHNTNKCLYLNLTAGVSNTDRMWPVRTFCAARDAFWEFSNN